MMTAPSTMSPKSRAPRLIRFALMRPASIPVAVIIMATGMTSAVMMAARMLPSARNRTAMTRSAPSARFLETVLTVASTRSVRLSSVRAWMPGGRSLLISLILASAAAETVRLFSPMSIRAVPSTTSCPFSLAEPVRSSRPTPTSATSLTKIGTPARVATTMSRIWSTFSMRPPARTT